MTYARAPILIHQGSFKSRKAHSEQQIADDWGAKRRFYLSMTEKELLPCKTCHAEGNIKIRKPVFNRSRYKVLSILHVCPECEGSGYDGIRS